MAEQRVSLTKKQLETPTGTELLSICESIKADGRLSKDEIIALAHWLGANKGCDLPAVDYLYSVVERIVADKRVSTEEIKELHTAIEKVMPTDARGEAISSRKEIERAAKEKQKERARLNREAIKQAEREAKQAQKEEAWQRKQLERASRPRAFHGKIAGVTKCNDDGTNRQSIISRYVKPGMELIVRREPDNPYDDNAIALWVKTRTLGFFEAERQIGFMQVHNAYDLAPYLDQGGWVRVTVKDVTGGGFDKYYGVNIFIEDGREVW
jgi:hypothetical protein